MVASSTSVFWEGVYWLDPIGKEPFRVDLGISPASVFSPLVAHPYQIKSHNRKEMIFNDTFVININKKVKEYAHSKTR